jgi:hypothetical protein
MLMAASSTVAPAAVVINFDNPSGNLGPEETYTNGAMTVTASGYSANNVDADLYGKNQGGNEDGLGLAGDPSGDNEIYGPGGAFISLDVSQILALASGMSFYMNSTTDGEQWSLYGSNDDDVLGALLFSGNDEGWHDVTDWGQFEFYQWTADGTQGSQVTFGNVLLGAVSINDAVPEPATWAMMLMGFGAVGFSLRRRRGYQVTFRPAA